MKIKTWEKEVLSILLRYLMIASILTGLFLTTNIRVEEQHGFYLPVVSIHPNIAYASTNITLYPDADPETTTCDGVMWHTVAAGADWTTLRAGAGSSYSDYGTTGFLFNITAGTGTTGNFSTLNRSGFSFDTTSVPVGATINSVTFGVYKYDRDDALSCTPSFNIYSFAPASNTALAAGDFDSFGATAYSDTDVTYADCAANGYKLLPFNATGIAAVEAILDTTDIINLGARESKYDVTGTDPNWVSSGYSRINVYLSENDTYRPYLEIEYTEGTVVAPTMTTNLATNITSINATLNGTVTATGGENPDCWFYWDTSDQGEIAANWSNNVSMGSQTGSFSTNITGLVDGTVYYFTVSGNNSVGWDWGSISNFTATDVKSFYYTSSELTALKALKAADSHSAVYNTIQDWVNAHYADTPIAQDVADGMEFKADCEDIRIFLDNMTFMYHMTDNATYAEAAEAQLMNIVDNWEGWYNPNDDDPQYIFALVEGMGNAYIALKEYMSSANRTKLANNIACFTYPTYAAYAGDPSPVTWPAKSAAITAVVGCAALALDTDSENSTDYLTLANLCFDESIQYGGGSDGGWTEGPNYSIRSGVFTRLFTYADALKRIKGTDKFTEFSGFLSNVPYYFLYLSQPDDHSTAGLVPIQVEDVSATLGYFTYETTALSWLYKSAKEYSDNNTEYMAETWASSNNTLDFVWRSSTVTANATTSLPLYRDMSSVGYIIFKDGWGTDNTTVLFKSGHSAYHAQPNQGTYMVYQYGRPLTCGNGYAVVNTEYKSTIFNNCITTGYVLGNDGKLYGYGQANEPGDMVDMGAADIPWGTGGNVTSVNVTDHYMHVEGDQSDVYIGEIIEEPENWPTLSSGNLTTWLRHLVYLPDLNVITLFDYVVSPIEQQVNWMFANRDLYNEDSTNDPPSLEWSGDTMTTILDGDGDVAVERRIEAKVLEPALFTTYSSNCTGNAGSEFRWTLLYPSDNATTQNFLVVESLNDSLSTGSVNATRISQDNLIGTKINDASYTWLVLFSTDNSSVSEWLDLGGSYIAADGEAYSFSDNTILVSFSSGFEVIKLASNESIVPPTVTTLAATDIDYDYANIGGTLNATGGEDAIELGLEWGLVSGVYTDNFTAFAPPFNEGTYVTSIYPSPPETTWFYRFFAVNSAGRTNGAELSFATLSYTAPSVTTGVASLVEETTATLSGEVTDIGGDNVTRGFAWGLITSPFSDNWSEGTYGTGAFNHPITGLSKGRKYVVHATANNTAGSDNGTDVNFMTKPDPASAFAATSYNTTWALLGWTNGDGMDLVSVRVLAGATAPSGNTTGTQVYWGNGTSVNATGLSEGTQYTFRIFTYALEDGTWSVADGSTTLTVTTSGTAPVAPTTPTSTDAGTWLLKNLISLAAALGAVMFVIYNIRTPSSWIVAIIAAIAVFLIVNALL
jgi:hypothetical protein